MFNSWTQLRDLCSFFEYHFDQSVPLSGMIKYDDTSGDFLGCNGTKWISLTLSNITDGGLLSSSKYKKIQSPNLENQLEVIHY